MTLVGKTSRYINARNLIPVGGFWKRLTDELSTYLQGDPLRGGGRSGTVDYLTNVMTRLNLHVKRINRDDEDEAVCALRLHCIMGGIKLWPHFHGEAVEWTW